MFSVFLSETCQLGSGSKCCRYLVMRGADGFRCAKLDPNLAFSIDVRAEQMNAKGDNCDGRLLSEALDV